MRRKNISAMLLMAVLFLGNADIEMARHSTYQDSSIYELLQKLSVKLAYSTQRKPFRIKKLNESLHQMSLALQAFFEGQPGHVTEGYLKSALHHFDGNSFVYFLMGVLKDEQGNVTAANEYYEKFLTEGRTYTDFEKTFVNAKGFHRVRRYAYDLLSSRGISFEGRESDIRTKISWMSYILHPNPEDRILMGIFALVLVGGGVLLVALQLLGLDFSGLIIRSMIISYISFWIGYGVWAFDIGIGLPYGLSRAIVIPVVFAISAGSVLMIWIRSWIERWTRKPAPGFQFCRKCRHEFTKLILECPECRTPSAQRDS